MSEQHRVLDRGDISKTTTVETDPSVSRATSSKSPKESAPAGTVAVATPGAKGFDTDTVLTALTASAFTAQGFSFVVRYLSLTAPEAAGDLTRPEAADILGAGLALMAVQHVPTPGWVPTQSLGRRYGKAAATNARSVGLPAGVCLWLDLEGVASGTSASDISGYCEAWSQQVTAADYYRAGLYVGGNCGLTGNQIDALRFPYYWQSGNTVPSVSAGYCMVQSINDDDSIDGVAYNLDMTASGRNSTGIAMPFWLAPPALVA